MSKQRLYLLDATAFYYRAFYAIRNLATSFGQPTNAIYGFLNILQKILKQEKPEHLAACFDISRKTFRQEKFAAYKIQRPPVPDELKSQIPFIKEIVRAYGIPLFEKEGFEADDIIASVSLKAAQEGFSVVVVSSDKDLLQLVGENIVVLNPTLDEGVLFDKEEIKKRFGIAPLQIADIISLMGDKVDNIPGIPGIGEKTAFKLIQEFGTLHALLVKRESIASPKVRKAIEDNLEQIKLNKELVTLSATGNIGFEVEMTKIVSANPQELLRIFKHLEFKKFLKGLPTESVVKEEGSLLSHLTDSQFKKIVRTQEEIVLAGSNFADLVFMARQRVFSLEDAGVNCKEALSDKKLLKIGHDLKYLAVSLAKERICLDGFFFDVMLAGYLLNPSKSSYLLSDLVWDYLQAHIAEEGLSNAERVSLIARLRSCLEKELHNKSLDKLFFDLEMPLARVLADMELEGIKVDLKVLKDLSKDIEKRLVGLIDEIYQASGTQFNINSSLQLRQILFEHLKLPVIKKGKTGPSTDEEVLKVLAREHALPALLLEYRKLTKLKTTYVDVLPGLVDKDTAKLHTSFNQAATETGRLSSSNPNLQNIPIKTEAGRRIRKALIASDEDSLLLSCDYSQIELRVLAHFSKDENLLHAFKEDKDVHKATAALIYGVKEEDVSDEMREMAKRVNFGIVYGQTSYGLSRELEIPVNEAQNFIDAYFLRFPKVKEYIQDQIIRAKEEGMAMTILGRRRYIPQINDKNQGMRQFAERQAVNTPLQGSASDIIKLAMLKIHRDLLEHALKTKMILQIHDELVFDVPAKELHKAAGLIKHDMENIMKLDVPLKVDMKKGKNWLEMEEVE